MLFPKIGMYFYNLHKKDKQKMATFLCNSKNNKVASFFLHIVILLNRLLRLFGGSSLRLLFDTAVIVFAAHPLNSCAKSHYRGMIFPLFSPLSKLPHLELFCRTTKLKLRFIKMRIVSIVDFNSYWCQKYENHNVSWCTVQWRLFCNFQIWQF